MALNTSLASFWNMDGSSVDSVSTRNGTDTSITYTSTNSLLGQSASFNGSTSLITLPANPVNWSQSHTISMWFRASAAPGGSNGAPLFEVWAGSAWNYGQPDIYYNPGTSSGVRVDSSIRDNSGIIASLSFGDNISLNVWHHLVYVYDQTVGTYGTFYAYLDGTAGSVTAQAASRATSNLTNQPYIGKSQGSYQTGVYNGLIDAIGIWSRALSSTEITQIYNGGKAQQYPFMGADFFINFL